MVVLWVLLCWLLLALPFCVLVGTAIRTGLAAETLLREPASPDHRVGQGATGAVRLRTSVSAP